MAVPQVDGLLEATYGRVDQLEDRYLGMVEAASSNLVSSTLIIHNVLVDATYLLEYINPPKNNSKSLLILIINIINYNPDYSVRAGLY